MKTLHNYKKLVLIIGMISCVSACKKQDSWLDVKRDKSDVVPEVLADFQAILDNNRDLQSLGIPGLASVDNYYYNDVNYLSAQEVDRNLYIWTKDIWVNGISSSWTAAFRNIGYANIALEGLQKLSPNQSGYNNVKGQALFWRAFTFNYLTQLFCKPFDPQTAGNDLGIPLRTSSDVNIIYQRATLQQTYSQIIDELNEAVRLLDETAPFTTRPIKVAAIAMLAKVYLSMGDYDRAFINADKVLSIKKTILDFNSSLVNLSVTYRFPDFNGGNPEVLFYLTGGGFSGPLISTSQTGFVLPTLYNSYNANDLRKTIFYLNTGNDNQVRARGTYSGRNANFNGIALNEILLIRAECLARKGKTLEAMDDLNLLLRNRYKTGSFVPITASDENHALSIILNERRKELAFTGNLRWEDLRRLNKDPRFVTTITRTIGGNTYILKPNDPKYTLPIPQAEIEQTGLVQNDR